MVANIRLMDQDLSLMTSKMRDAIIVFTHNVKIVKKLGSHLYQQYHE